MKLTHVHTTKIPIGTPIFCVIRYPSGIHRVQKLIAGANGNFELIERIDKTFIRLRGNYQVDCFFDYDSALEKSKKDNVEEHLRLAETISYFKNRFSNLSKFMGQE